MNFLLIISFLFLWGTIDRAIGSLHIADITRTRIETERIRQETERLKQENPLAWYSPERAYKEERARLILAWHQLNSGNATQEDIERIRQEYTTE